MLKNIFPPSQGGSIWNLALIGPVVSEEMFVNVDGLRRHAYTMKVSIELPVASRHGRDMTAKIVESEVKPEQPLT